MISRVNTKEQENEKKKKIISSHKILRKFMRVERTKKLISKCVSGAKVLILNLNKITVSQLSLD